MRSVNFVRSTADLGHQLSTLRVEFFEKVRDKDIKHFYIHYHNPCSDGLAALYSTITGLKAMFGATEYSITPVAAKYGTVPDMQYGQDSCLIVVDFAYPPDVINNVDVGLVVLLDHHESALQDYKSYGGGFDDDVIVIFDDENTMSGAGLAWRFFNRDTIPHLIAAIEKRDIWDKNFLFVEEAHLFASKYNSPTRFDVWDKAVASRESMVNYLSEFTPLVEKQQETCKTIADQATIKSLYAFRVKGLNVCPFTGAASIFDLPEVTERTKTATVAIVNCHGMFASDVGSLLNVKANIAIMFSVEGPNKVKLSMRANTPTGLLALTKFYGGGGHKNAAGCVLTMDQFVEFYQLNFSDQPPVQPVVPIESVAVTSAFSSFIGKIRKWISKS